MGEQIRVTTPDGVFEAYVARPAATKAPAVVVIQEIFGVNQVMRDITDGLAGQGYLAICPDLFWRIEPGVDITDKSEAEWKKAFDLYGKFNVDKGVQDIQATIDVARADAGCSGKVGTVGFCLGGLLAYLSAGLTSADGAVSYYGVGIEGRLADAPKAPLLMHIAEGDQFVPPAAQDAIKTALSGAANVTIHSYPGRDHAFARVGGEHYDATDAEAAGRRSLAFFGKALA